MIHIATQKTAVDVNLSGTVLLNRYWFKAFPHGSNLDIEIY